MKKFKQRLKGMWRSSTMCVNAMFIAMLPLYNEFLVDLPILKAYMPDNIYQHVGLAVVIVNMFLRFRTNTDLAHK